MQRTWILVANAARARLCEFDPRDASLTELEGFVHAPSRQRAGELAPDRAGQAEKGQPSAHTSFAPHTDARHKEREQFARELAQRLDEAVLQHRCAALALFASNPFLGEVKSHLGPAAARELVATAPLDLKRTPRVV